LWELGQCEVTHSFFFFFSPFFFLFCRDDVVPTLFRQFDLFGVRLNGSDFFSPPPPSCLGGNSSAGSRARSPSPPPPTSCKYIDSNSPFSLFPPLNSGVAVFLGSGGAIRFLFFPSRKIIEARCRLLFLFFFLTARFVGCGCLRDTVTFFFFCCQKGVRAASHRLPLFFPSALAVRSGKLPSFLPFFPPCLG